MVGIINFLIVLAFAFIPSVLWLAFFLKEDLHPEPRKLIIFTFCAGALMSVPVLIFQLIFQNFVAQPLHIFILLVFGLALIEELFKFFSAYWSVNKEPAFDEPVDAMIYAIVAAMGFATIENLFIMGDKMYYLSANNLLISVSTLGFRFIGATLLHGLSSAFVGYYWALGRKIGKIKPYVALGLGIAILIHFIFNYLVYQFENMSLLYPSIFLVFVAIFIFKDFSKLKS
jgi:RsiW-degrading membrane proteinase PrsW (M82 family)